MDSPRDITTAIRGFLANQGSSASTPMGDVAAIYAEYCRDANGRLRRCAAYLKQGRRTEAIHLSEVSPDLLERVNDLDLLEFAEWVGVCESNGFETPPRLMTEVAAQINDAYATEHELAPLLKKQRAMALAGLPLSQRLEVQRALLAADPNHPTWEEDLRLYEQARLRELLHDSQQAYDASDAEALNEVLRELNQSPWQVEVPIEQLEGVRRQAREVEVAKATQWLHELMPQLDEAYIAMAEADASELAQRWRQIVAKHQLEVPTELLQRFEPIEKWLRNLAATEAMERDFAESCGTLAIALEQDLPALELESLYAQTLTYDQPLPEDLEARYRAVQAEQLLASRRRRNVAIGLATPIVLVLLVALSWFVIDQRDTYRASQFAEELREYTVTGQLDSGLRLVERLDLNSPRLFSYDDLKQARGNFELARTKRQSQRGRMASLLEMLETAVTREEPVDSEWVAAVNQQVVEARTLAEAISDPDMAERLGYLEQSAAPLVTAWQTHVDSQFQQRLQNWASGDFQELDSAELVRDLTNFESTIERLTRELNVITLTPHVSPSALTTTEYYVRTLERYEDAIAEQRQLASVSEKANAALDAALEVASVPARYVQRLEAAARLQTDVGRAADFQAAVRMAPYLDAVQRWEAQLQSWDGKIFPDDADAIQSRLNNVRRLRDGQPAAFDLPGQDDLWDALRAAERSLSSRGIWHGGFADYLRSTPAISRLCMVKDRAGRIYFTDCDTELTPVSDGVVGQVYSQLDFSRVSRRTLQVDETDVAPELSYQSQLAEDLLSKLTELGGSNWREIGITLAELIQARDNVDAILRVAMMDRVLEAIGRVTPEVDLLVTGYRDEIANLDVLDTDWIDPDNASAEPARARSRVFLDGLEFEPLRENLARLTLALESELNYEPVGYGIALVEDGGWTILTRLSPREGTTARVVVPQPARGGAELREIGIARDGDFKIAAPDMVGVLEGSLVFLWRPLDRASSRAVSVNRITP